MIKVITAPEKISLNAQKGISLFVLLSYVERDEKFCKNSHDFRGKLDWIIARVRHYAEKTGLSPVEILSSWENMRGYWYMNFYQERNQPLLNSDKIRIFETIDEFQLSLGIKGFRCPICNGVSSSFQECNSGVEIEPGKKCDWKTYGLFSSCDDIYIFIKKNMCGFRILKPIVWEKNNDR